MNDIYFNNWLRFGEDDKKLKAHEIAKEWRRNYFAIDAELNKARRAVEMHPEKYAMGFLIQPAALYNHELARAKYEIGVELANILKSKPEPLKPNKKKGEPNDKP